MKFMTILILLLLAPDSFATDAVDLKQFNDEQKLSEMWHEEAIYLILKTPDNPMNFSGDLFHYSSGSCVRIDHDRNRKNALLVSRIPCSKKLKRAASESYKKISDFQKFKESFQSCLKKQDKKCLRPFVAKTLQSSFGPEPLMDRRDLVFKSWSKKDFDEMLSLIQKGTVESEERRSFPPQPSNEGIGKRGIFTKKNGFWLLTHYLAGD